jgi:hypothetical protein
VYLHGDSLIVGPWIVVGRANAAHVGHPKDQSAVKHEASKREPYARYDRSAADNHRPPEWLHLRPSRDMRAGINPDRCLIPDGKLVAKKVQGGDLAVLRRTVIDDVQEVLEALARSKQQEHEANVNATRELMRAHGKAISPEPANPYDPYDDEQRADNV